MRFLSPLFLLSALFIGAVFAYPTLDNIDQEMLIKSQVAQANLYVRKDHSFERHLPPPDYIHVHNFKIRALEMAHDEVVKVDTYRNPDIETTTTGVRKYFYSVIEPHTRLGEDMGLANGNGKVATVLWRHEIDRLGRDDVKMVHVDTVNHAPNVEWPLETLKEVIKHH
ncbi:hypothetical protein NDA16_003199 [Ustilago loliicola]|nr:hypothetical protein NDA16_003199 [Ustilago loliicola]